MNRYLILIASFSMLISSCSQDEYSSLDDSIKGKAVTGLIMENTSRTYLDNNQDVIWNDGDAISIFGNTGYHYHYALKDGSGTTSANFEYINTVGSADGNTTEYNYAVYPFSNNHLLLADNKISVDVSSWAMQYYVESTFENEKAFMTGKSLNTVFPFYNAQSLARVELSSVVPGSYSISSISFHSETLALNGTAVINMTEDKPVLVCTDTENESCKTNTLLCSPQIMLTDSPKYFYIVMPSATYKDLTLTIRGTNKMDKSDLFWSVTLDEDVTFNRSSIKRFTKQFEAVDFSGEILPD